MTKHQSGRIDIELLATRLSRLERIAMGTGAFTLFAMLMTAAWLRPDPSGQGTHQQLGLPSCTMFATFGIRCPGCGMTTSWAHVMNGDLVSGLHANSGGVVLCLIAVVCTPILAAFAMRGRGSRGSWFPKASLGAVVAAMLLAIVEWLLRIGFVGQ